MIITIPMLLFHPGRAVLAHRSPAGNSSPFCAAVGETIWKKKNLGYVLMVVQCI